jgi:NAD-dependent SIR2 family protein deacetylase
MLSTSGTVVFIGAGASAAFGLPVTNQILRRIVGRLRRGLTGAHPLFPGPKQSRLQRELQDTLSALYPGLQRARGLQGLPNITNVLSQLDHLILYEQPASLKLGKDRLIQGRRLLERAMMEVLLDTDLSPVMKKLGREQKYSLELEETRLTVNLRATSKQKATLARFLDWLMAKKEGRRPLTLVTTNYDLAFETPLYRRSEFVDVADTIDFGFDWRIPYPGDIVPRPAEPKIRLYKLHGSLNWLRCNHCGQMYVNPGEVIAYISFWTERVWANTCECGAFPLRHLIVAPSMVRDIRDPHLLNVWRNATEALRTAAEWIMIGYSLPAEDLAIRSMLLRAFTACGLSGNDETDLKYRRPRSGPEVTVVQYGSAARAAYAGLFQRFRYYGNGLDQFLTSAAAWRPIPSR